MKQREIKFRCWDKLSLPPKMLDGLDVIKGIVNLPKDIPFANTLEGLFNIDSSVPNRYILMQFTGLTDKNGKEIYESDLVKTKWQEKAEMTWVETEAAFGLRTVDEVVKDEIMYGFKDTEMEIIGNIYERN